jgi:hypothetical protein
MAATRRASRYSRVMERDLSGFSFTQLIYMIRRSGATGRLPSARARKSPGSLRGSGELEHEPGVALTKDLAPVQIL